MGAKEAFAAADAERQARASYEASMEDGDKPWKELTAEERGMTARSVNIEAVAKVCHEVNRAYCQALGDASQPSWEDAPDWQKDSARKGVEFHLANPDADASASHDSWLAQKRADGWIYGEKKDPDARPPTHPCIVEFKELPREQQAKDFIFRAVVHAMKD